MANVGLNATLGKTAANRGGTHGGINPQGGGIGSGAQVVGQQAGNPGTANPWEGADATPKPGELPPLKSL